jgi:hypothetical protein
MLPRLHISLEAVSTHDLMCMRTAQEPRIYKGIESFDGELGTGKAHHRCATRIVLRVGGAQKSEHMEYSDLHDRNKLFKCECWRSQIARIEMYVHMAGNNFTRHCSSVWGSRTAVVTSLPHMTYRC